MEETVLSVEIRTERWSELGYTLLYWALVSTVLIIISLVFDFFKERPDKKIKTVKHAPNGNLHSIRSFVPDAAERSLWAILIETVDKLWQTLNIWCWFFQFSLSLLVCTTYVVRCYRPNSYPHGLLVWEGVSNAFFLIHMLFFRLRDAPTAKFFFLKPLVLLDILSIVSWARSFNIHPAWLTMTFVRAFMVASSYRHSQNTIRNILSLSDFKVKLGGLLTNSFALVYSFAGFIFLIENIGEVPQWDKFQNEDSPIVITFFQSIYFIFVTLSTVGYGDISPNTILGQTLVILFIVGGILLFAQQCSELIDSAQKARLGNTKFVRRHGSSFVLVCGNPSYEALRDFIHEIFHPDHSLLSDYKERQVVILTQDMPYFPALKLSIKSSSTYRNHVTFLTGSPLNSADLLGRAMALSPALEACFVISDSSDNSETHTHRMIAAAVSINRTVNQPSKIYMLLNRPLYADFVESMGLRRQCVFSMRIKMNLLATSCIAPGFTALLANLLTSRTLREQDRLAPAKMLSMLNPISAIRGSQDPPSSLRQKWLKEYEKGAEKEFYTVVLDSCFLVNCPSISMLAQNIYKKFGISVICVRDRLRDKVLTSPADPVPLECAALVIASDVSELAPLGIHERRPAIKPPQTQLNSPTHSTEVELVARRESRIRASQVMLSMESLVVHDSEMDLDKEDIGEDVSESSSSIEADILRRERQIAASINLPDVPHGSNQPGLHGHIVVLCSSTRSIAHFINPIRARERNLSNQDSYKKQPIVILSSSPYKEQHFQINGRNVDVENVFFHLGFATSRTHLIICDVQTASNVVLLNSDEEVIDKAKGEEDINSVLHYIRVTKFLNRFQADTADTTVVADMQTEIAMRLCLPYKERTIVDEVGMWRTGKYAAGVFYSRSLPHQLLYLSFWNKRLLQFLDCLMGEADKSGSISQIDIPPGCEHMNYGELHEFLTSLPGESAMVPIGLYRFPFHSSCTDASSDHPAQTQSGSRCLLHCNCGQHSDASDSYVLTSPHKEVRLCTFDRVFVILRRSFDMRAVDISFHDSVGERIQLSPSSGRKRHQL